MMPDSGYKIDTLIEMLKQGSKKLLGMSKNLEFAWDPTLNDPRRLHNMYVRNLITSYTSKFADLSDGILFGIEKSNFLIYALCGRALIETTATLRYYVFHEYKPLMDKGSFSSDDFKKLIDIDDKHLRGSRFDWESFLFLDYKKLKEDAVNHLNEKKKKKTKKLNVSESIRVSQKNALTCVEKWAEETPEILIAYNLFCDLVHPNIGSTFLVASISSGKLYFSKTKGEPVGLNIFKQSFPILLSVTHKPFGEYLLYIMGTIWQEDEI
jgi:hypothetical protein